MPQGKGTYGSKVGRPPKKGKKKYYGGGSVDPFSAKNPEGVMVKKEMEAIDEANMQKDIQDSIPIANAQDRSQESPMGNEVGTGVYAVGGEVIEGIRTRVQDIRHRHGEKKEERKKARKKKKVDKLQKKLNKLKGFTEEGAPPTEAQKRVVEEQVKKMKARKKDVMGEVKAKKAKVKNKEY